MAAISEAISAGWRSPGAVVRATAMPATALLLALCLPALPAHAAPKEPDFQLVGDSRTGRSCCDTSDTTPRIGGRTSPGATVTVELRKQYDDPEPRYTDTVTADGKGRFEFQFPEIKRRVNEVRVIATLDGKSRGFSRTILIDTEAPTGTYVLALGPDMQKPAPAKTTTRELTAVLSHEFLKDGEENFGLYREDGEQVETGFPRGGNFEIVLPENETHTYRLINIDAAGNAGPASEPVTITQKIERSSIATIDVKSLRGGGIKLENAAWNDEDYLGLTAAGLGDVNGDGYADVAIGSQDANSEHGLAVVVFGAARKRLPRVVDVVNLTGKNGFRVEGGPAVGRALGGGGDVNGDGLHDIVMRNSDDESAWVLYGRERFPDTIVFEEKNRDRKRALRITKGREIGTFGQSVAIVGDVNGDRVDDIAIGAPDAKQSSGEAGSAFLVFGRAEGGFPAEIAVDDLDGRNGFRMDAAKKGDGTGNLVAAAGDFNADGIDDFLVGAPFASPDGRRQAGIVYVVFGRKGEFPERFSLGDLDGRTGFAMPGPLAGDWLGYGFRHGVPTAAAAGDVNGDGIDDIVLTAAGSKESSFARMGFVVFGAKRKTFDRTFDLTRLDGMNGFRADPTFRSVSGVGDMNGDGFDDLAFDGGPTPWSGYVLLGQENFPKLVEFDTTPGVATIRLVNMPGGVLAPAGDVDRDGRADLLIGSDQIETDGVHGPGGGYVLFGQAWK